MNITPLHIEIVLHYNCTTAPMEHATAPAVQEYIRQLLGEEILIWVSARPVTNGHYGLTEKGKAWLEMILATPFPVQRWVAP